MSVSEEIEARFPTSVSGGVPTDEMRALSVELREHALSFAGAVDEIPNSRWKSLALTSIEEALMWANKANFNR